MDPETDDLADSMQSPNNSLRQRLLTILLLLPVLVLAIWWDLWSTTLVAIVASMIGLHELYTSFTQHGTPPFRRFGFGFAACIIAATWYQTTSGHALVQAVLAIGMIASLIITLVNAHHAHVLTAWAFTMSGVLYVVYLLAYLIPMRAITVPLQAGVLSAWIAPGVAWIVFTLATTWLGDAFAYFSGRRFGKHPLAPHISPKKTWEGSIGGLLGAIATGIGCVPLLGVPIPLWGGAVIGVLAGILGPLGDLAESQIKRQLGVKDAGSILPGHGGMLDRIDSILFMLPIVYYIAIWLT
ncbi:MAG: phosphatidate cytidylyltransferase [Chloroflexia bacterium]|nr:phosphatidate cytidylyltransferase [Chloroflexia bacterium]